LKTRFKFITNTKEKGMNKNIRIWRYIIFFAVVLGPALTNGAEGTESPWNRFNLNIGGFSTALSSNTTLGLNNLGFGIDINTEDAYGLDSSIVAVKADANYRFTRNRRHMVDFTYLNLSRSGEKILEREIPVFDETLTIGTFIQSKFDFQIFKIGYSYSFFQDDRFDLGGRIGLYIMPIEFALTADGIGAGAEDITAPLPTLGLRFDFAITPKLFLRQYIDLFYLSIGDFRGAIVNSSVTLDYNFWKYVGLGIGLENFRMRVESEGSGDYPGIDLFGHIDYEYIGLLLFAKVYF
jgi:hypothetical protein